MFVVGFKLDCQRFGSGNRLKFTPCERVLHIPQKYLQVQLDGTVVLLRKKKCSMPLLAVILEIMGKQLCWQLNVNGQTLLEHLPEF